MSDRSRGGRGGSWNRGSGERRPRDEGRASFQRRQREERRDRSSKRQRTDGGDEGKEEQRKPRALAEGEVREERKPKKKVAVLIGYCGTGYKGMQLNPPTKTIEGDLFDAFVKAGAISKDNSDDPKKSSLVRCARTDKGVHAAGNLISLKLIIEDPKTIENINKHLVPQIRVWDIVPTTGGFSCYQLCDSRKYEYLVPTHCFLPPHPSTLFAKKLRQFAEEENDLESWESRMEDVEGFWAIVMNKCRSELRELGYDEEVIEGELLGAFEEGPEEKAKTKNDLGPEEKSWDTSDFVMESKANLNVHSELGTGRSVESEPSPNIETQETQQTMTEATEVSPTNSSKIGMDQMIPAGLEPHVVVADLAAGSSELAKSLSRPERELTPEQSARKLIKALYLRERQAYRINPIRFAAVRSAFKLYEGTNNFHNFTVQKKFGDASAKRNIRSFVVEEPVIINDTEWLSLRIHGQSFMMHQIRKMVGLVMLVIRSGCPLERITELYGPPDVPIPKAPSLGLLLDHPLFEVYNKKAEEFSKKPLDFSIHEEKIKKFKQEFIYDKLFLDEEKNHVFNAFLAFLDNFQTPEFDYLTSKGMKAVRKAQLNLKRTNRDNGMLTTAVTRQQSESSDDEDNVDS